MSYEYKNDFRDAGPNHWTNGGTGITNFDPEDEPLYLQAIKKSGHDNLRVSHSPYNGQSWKMFSLHYIDVNKRDVENGLSSFWKVFDEIKKGPTV